MPPRDTVVRILTTLIFGFAGGGLFTLVGLPAGWLSGAMLAVAVISVLKVPTGLPDRGRDGLFVVLGVIMGAGVRPEALERFHEWPVTLLLLLVVMIATIISIYSILRTLASWPRETAFFGAIPGALSFVLALAADRKADLSRIAVSQSIRLLILSVILPSILASTQGGLPESAPSQIDMSLPEALMLAVCCLIAGWISNRLRIPGGWLTGAFFASALLNANGVLAVVLPEWLLLVSYVALGAYIGSRFGSISLADLVKLIGAGLAAVAAGLIVAGLGAYAASSIVDIPFGQALLAFAPGGLEVMTLLAFLLDMDPAFVATHQLVRYVGLVLLVPLATTLLFGRVSKSAE